MYIYLYSVPRFPRERNSQPCAQCLFHARPEGSSETRRRLLINKWLTVVYARLSVINYTTA